MDPQLEEARLAQRYTREDQTLVIYMGLVGLPQIMGRLLENGCSADHPVAVIENATLAHQRVVVGTVGHISDLVAEAEVSGPSIVIVGQVVKYARNLTGS